MKSIRVWLLFWPVSITVTIVGTLLLAISWPIRNTRVGSRIMSEVPRLWAVALLWSAGLRITVESMGNLGDGPYVFVVNHSSLLDIPAALAVLSGLDFRIVSRHQFFRVPVLGWAMRIAGHIELEREGSTGSQHDTLRTIEDRLDGGQSVLVFDEGTRSLDGKIQEFRGLAFSAAIGTQVDIVPVRFWGLFEALPKGSFQPRCSEVEILIGDPVSTEGMKPAHRKRLTEDVHRWFTDLEQALPGDNTG